ncbi:hypothetical protein PIB30_036521 [Stylosanthes scabra]|uniref:Uncharacterized protein n=1 Tax=Stylosanthes scabra TaxID=79078 RepID=A0ABU6RDV3_9FABA|nr:hypothetical protein [Stylosanthes scabra]
MPVCMWCNENFEEVAKLWGKSIKWDDRDDREFEVFVKEFGPELYSVESHPDRLEGYSYSGDGTSEGVEVVLTPTESGQSPYNEKVGAELIHLRNNEVVEKEDIEESETTIFKEYNLGFDPMVLEAQLGNNDKAKSLKRHMASLGLGMYGPNKCNVFGLDSATSCPYPPGFGPCALGGHIHRSEDKVTDSPNFVRETPLVVSEGDDGRQILDKALVVYGGNRGSSTNGSDSTSSETLYRINWDKVKDSFQHTDDIETRACGGGGIGASSLNTENTASTEEIGSAETLYRINPAVVSDKRDEVDEPLENGDDGGDDGRDINVGNGNDFLVDEDTAVKENEGDELGLGTTKDCFQNADLEDA